MIVKLTKRAVDTLAPIAKPFVAYDADLPGFGLRVMPSGVKSFVAETIGPMVAGARRRQKRRVTIGQGRNHHSGAGPEGRRRPSRARSARGRSGRKK